MLLLCKLRQKGKGDEVRTVWTGKENEELAVLAEGFFWCDRS